MPSGIATLGSVPDGAPGKGSQEDDAVLTSSSIPARYNAGCSPTADQRRPSAAVANSTARSIDGASSPTGSRVTPSGHTSPPQRDSRCARELPPLTNATSRKDQPARRGGTASRLHLRLAQRGVRHQQDSRDDGPTAAGDRCCRPPRMGQRAFLTRHPASVALSTWRCQSFCKVEHGDGTFCFTDGCSPRDRRLPPGLEQLVRRHWRRCRRLPRCGGCVLCRRVRVRYRLPRRGWH